MSIPKPNKEQKRVIILGAGFAGLKLARRLACNKNIQVLLIDKNNYHQFQPLLYQVATAALEPSSISFPIRRVFQNKSNVFIRVAGVDKIDTEDKVIHTEAGIFFYDMLVIALGTDTNYYGNKQLEEKCIGLKTVPEALYLRNMVLKNYEKALVTENEKEREAALNVVIVGGGPTGVELSGAIAEMKKNILPKEYPELDFSKMNIYLIEAVDRLLNSMSEFSSQKATKYLERLGVKILLKTHVESYDGEVISTNQGQINSACVVWAAGVRANSVLGISAHLIGKSGRIIVNEFNEVDSLQDVYAIGDIAFLTTKAYPYGHPQVAPVAIQQANNLARNLTRKSQNKPLIPFKYVDKGSMATVGRNLAVVELPFVKFGGFVAWLTWMFVHLMSILGVRNRFLIFINWVSNYFTYNLSLRLIIKPFK
ncbi:MAG TPA: NAD(P)/FAD-dependent oxidoreductase [Prolixibacteraceae bacterium]|nr:NAD(P)/FAD-dependent oxidoreductase [Prolixibacteraceae bacterium]